VLVVAREPLDGAALAELLSTLGTRSGRPAGTTREDEDR
jgi:hypothetical protein